MRFYDSDVARFLSLDPLAAQFPEWSDYNYVLGNPVMFIDPDGKEPQQGDPTKGIEANIKKSQTLNRVHSAARAKGYNFSDEK
jgi:hypothetical protein